MKVLPFLFLLFASTITFGQAVAKPDAKLLDAAIEKYLGEMKAKFKIAPTEFIIETEDKTVYQNVKKTIGTTTITVKTKKELQDFSQKAGKAVGFFVIDVEKSGSKFLVNVIDDGIKANGANFTYDSVGAGRACTLTFNSSFAFESIDCLLLPTDK